MKIIIYLIFTILVLFIIKNIIEYQYTVELRAPKNGINDICKKCKQKDLEKKGFLSDKYLVKKHIDDNYSYMKTAKLLYETKDAEKLKDFDLPENFVIKSSSGSRMFIIVKNNKYNMKNLIKESKKFLNRNYSTHSYRAIPYLGLEEPHYDYNDKRIIVEEYLGDVKEFRMLVIKGKIVYYEMVPEYYDQDFNKIDVEYGKKKYNKKLILPKNIDIINKFIKDIYEKENIEFARFDFYLKDDEVYFSELTFTPENCMHKYSNFINKKAHEIHLNRNHTD